MKPYDFLFTFSTFHSNNMALGLLRSLKELQARSLAVIVSPVREDLTQIHDQAPDVEAVYIHSKRNSMYFGRAWGFVWAVNNGVEACYTVTCDDDLVFLPAASQIPERLDQANSLTDFCLMGFSSSHARFPTRYIADVDRLLIGLEWLDGNCIFAKWEDALEFGVIDNIPQAPRSFFVEVEYCHRFRTLSGRPIVFDNTPLFYYDHVFRRDPQVLAIRSLNDTQAIGAGNQLWKDKFHLEHDFNHGDHEQVYLKLKDNPAIYQRHLLFDGLWTQWDQIYEKYRDQTELIFDGRKVGVA